ncbi:MAG: DUF3025 domain-containing protein [Nitrosomonadales bacterium]|nr:DUF3025 domain-containing protein [Nitrosomonadales bacterium]
MKTIPEWNKESLLELHSFCPLHQIIERLDAEGFPTLSECNELLAGRQPVIRVQNGKALRFVPQEYGKLSFEAQYEPRCYLSGEVATRPDNWHDLLNALVWLTFPKAKAAINVRHYRALTMERGETTHSQRGAVRDTNTLLDESGVIVPCADAELAGLLRDFRWKELFWQRRADVRNSMDFYLFGHGLYEKALQPYVGMTGQGLLLPVRQDFFAWPLQQRLAHLDERLAEYLCVPEHCSSTRELTPVPLLGVPGWSKDNECESYYENSRYFRPGRQSRAQCVPLSTVPSSVAG